MIEAFLLLEESVTLTLAVNRMIVFASTFDYSGSVLDQVFSRLSGLEIDSMVVVVNSPLTKHKYDNEVEIFSTKVNNTEYRCVMASEDVAKIQELASQLDIQSVKLVSELGLGKMVDSSNYCVVTKNELNHCVMEYRQGVLVGVLVTNSTGFKEELQKFVTRTNTPYGYDLGNLPSNIPEYFRNGNQLSASFAHALEVFSFAMTPVADSYSTFLEEEVVSRQPVADKEEAEEEEEEEDWGEEETKAEDEEEGWDDEDDWGEDEEEEKEESARNRSTKVGRQQRSEPEPLVLEKKRSPLAFVSLAIAVLSLGVAGYMFTSVNKSNKELKETQLARVAETQEVERLSLASESIEQSQKVLKALRVVVKNKTVKSNLVAVSTEDFGLITVKFTGSESTGKKIAKALDTKFVVSDVAKTGETTKSGKKVSSVYCSLE